MNDHVEVQLRFTKEASKTLVELANRAEVSVEILIKVILTLELHKRKVNHDSIDA
jgi:hypothetical protein